MDKKLDRDKLFLELKKYFENLLKENDLFHESVEISAKPLSKEEAIGNTKRKDFPIIVGREVMVEAKFLDGKGQAFTSAPKTFSGSIKDMLEMDIMNDDYARSLFIASLNAVSNHLGFCNCSVHCRDNGPEECGKKMAEYIKLNYKDKKIALIGYQPAILENISKENPVKVLDLNPDNIGKEKHGAMIYDGIEDYESIMNWADVVLCTGSTICNGTIVDFLNLDKEVLFYGTSLAGIANFLKAKRVCFADEV